jgi:ribonuclease BN (tRNA processing enzyme)
VTPVPVNHLVPTVGFLIKQGPVSVLYSGDTYETDDIWAVASKEPTLKAALIESSFPDRMGELARLSKHLTPTLFAEQFRKIGRPHLPVYAYHLKPRFERDIVSELSQQGIANLSVLQEGMELTL